MRVPALQNVSRNVFLDVLLFVFPAVLLACCWCGTAQAVTWSGTTADQVISFDDDANATAVQVWARPAGPAHAVWVEQASATREIHYGRTDDSGITWSSATGDRVISFPDGHSVDPEACAISGIFSWHSPLIVAWSEAVTGTREVHYGISTNHGATWSSENQDLVLSDPATATDTGAPSVVLDQQSRMHVVWTQMSSAGTVEVFYSRSTDNGATWSGTTADRRISFPDGNDAASPQIVAANQALVVVWREASAAGGSAIHAGISTDWGTTWSSETADREISQPATLIGDLATSADVCLDDVHVVYTASFDSQPPFHYEVFATSSGNSGRTFNGATVNVPVSFDEGGGRSAANPDVYFGAAQGAVVVWDEEDEATGTREIHVSYGYGGPWSGAAADEIISFPNGEDGYRPSIFGYQCMETAGRGMPNAIPVGADRGLGALPRVIYADTYALWSEHSGGAVNNYEVNFSGAAFIVGSVDEIPAVDPMLQVLPNPSSGSLELRWRDLPGEEVRSVQIFDAAGRAVYAWTLTPDAPADDNSSGASGSVRWDRRDQSGRTASAGCYFARVRTTRGGSRTTPFVLL